MCGVLLDDKHQPAQLITFDPQDGYLLIQRLNDVKEGQEDSMQLWALDDQDRPLSRLGVCWPTKIRTAQIPRTFSDKSSCPRQRIWPSVWRTREAWRPGKPPRLPFLFSGALIQKTL
jgi:hypothetical protein